MIRNITFLLSALIIVSTNFSSAHAMSSLKTNYDVLGEDDHLPWPWGTECPFPWDNIIGVWKTSKPQVQNDETPLPVTPYFYEFKVNGETSTGSKIVEIIKYNDLGEIVGNGRGYSHPEQKIVRAVILAAPGVEMANHRVIVRAYRQNSTLSCGSELVTVLTTRSMSGQRSTDIHFVLKKVPSNQ